MREVSARQQTLRQNKIRAVAQLGRAPGSGPGGRGFKSHQPDLLLGICELCDAVTIKKRVEIGRASCLDRRLQDANLLWAL
jgi:UDP-3-O-[3-hydroxymyristoyl] glucosamine N-acyltransferase